MKTTGFIILLSFLAACTVGPKPMAYGEEFCHFCRMTIVDKQHAAQLVTEKGKIFNFDAIECMTAFIAENEDTPMAFILVNDYLNPGTFIEAQKATFIISPEIPSPMGANLSAVESQEKGNEVLTGKTGRLYEWEELLTNNHMP